MTPTAPIGVPPSRRKRSSMSSASSPYALSDDWTQHMSLGEVRERLARNERVLNSALMSTSPVRGFGMSPGGGAGVMPSGASSAGMASSPTQSLNGGGLAEDPVRARLLAVRDQLRAREAELVAEGMGSLDINSNPQPHTSPPPTRSAKEKAFRAIRANEAAGPSSARALPLDSSLALSEREFEKQTAANFAAMNMDDGEPRRRPRKDTDIDEETALEAKALAKAYARRNLDHAVFRTDDDWAADDAWASQRPDGGNGLSFTSMQARRDQGYADDMFDHDDDDNWYEHNDDPR